jgi:hypothetical protein
MGQGKKEDWPIRHSEPEMGGKLYRTLSEQISNLEKGKALFRSRAQKRTSQVDMHALSFKRAFVCFLSMWMRGGFHDLPRKNPSYLFMLLGWSFMSYNLLVPGFCGQEYWCLVDGCNDTGWCCVLPQLISTQISMECPVCPFLCTGSGKDLSCSPFPVGFDRTRLLSPVPGSDWPVFLFPSAWSLHLPVGYTAALHTSTLKMETGVFFKMLVTTDMTKQCGNPEDHNLNSAFVHSDISIGSFSILWMFLTDSFSTDRNSNTALC